MKFGLVMPILVVVFMFCFTVSCFILKVWSALVFVALLLLAPIFPPFLPHLCVIVDPALDHCQLCSPALLY